MSARNALFTLLLGGAGGALFYTLGSPAPFMLGALLSCWLGGALFPKIRANIGMGKDVRRVFLALAATLLGSFVTASVLLSVAQSWVSVVVLLLTGLAMTWCSYFYLAKVRKLDPIVAWFSSQPAGVSEVVLISREYTDQDHVVALFHLIRVSTVFICTPLIVWLGTSDFDGQAVPQGQAHFWQVDWMIWPALGTIAFAGVWLGRRLRLPIHNMLGPMILSALCFALYSLGDAGDPQRPWELICLVQVALGGSVGARMAQVSLRELGRYAVDAYVNAGLMIGITILGAAFLWWITGENLLKFLLAIAPGGLSELSLLAVTLGFEVAFVTLHHLIRMGFILFVMPFGTRWVSNQADPPSSR